MNGNMINLPDTVENGQDLHVYSQDIMGIEAGPDNDQVFQVYLFQMCSNDFRHDFLLGGTKRNDFIQKKSLKLTAKLS